MGPVVSGQRVFGPRSMNFSADPWGPWAAGEAAFLKGLATQPFHRYLNRCLLVLAVGGLWPLARGLGLGGWRSLGLAWLAGSQRRLGWGLVVGFASLLAAAGIMAMAGVRTFNFNLPLRTVLTLVVNATLSGIVVAVVEELFFRGLIFNALRRAWSLLAALAVSSLFYASVHFLARVQHAGPVEWSSGLALLPAMLGGLAAPENLVALVSLTLGGAVLALAYHRTGTLWFSIGLHAGWIFWLKVFKTVTLPGPTPGGEFWGTDKLVDGWLTALVMAGLLAGVARWPLLGQSPGVAHERPPGPST